MRWLYPGGVIGFWVSQMRCCNWVTCRPTRPNRLTTICTHLLVRVLLHRNSSKCAMKISSSKQIFLFVVYDIVSCWTFIKYQLHIHPKLNLISPKTSLIRPGVFPLPWFVARHADFLALTCHVSKQRRWQIFSMHHACMSFVEAAGKYLTKTIFCPNKNHLTDYI